MKEKKNNIPTEIEKKRCRKEIHKSKYIYASKQRCLFPSLIIQNCRLKQNNIFHLSYKVILRRNKRWQPVWAQMRENNSLTAGECLKKLQNFL